MCTVKGYRRPKIEREKVGGKKGIKGIRLSTEGRQKRSKQERQKVRGKEGLTL